MCKYVCKREKKYDFQKDKYIYENVFEQGCTFYFKIRHKSWGLDLLTRKSVINFLLQQDLNKHLCFCRWVGKQGFPFGKFREGNACFLFCFIFWSKNTNIFFSPKVFIRDSKMCSISCFEGVEIGKGFILCRVQVKGTCSPCL